MRQNISSTDHYAPFKQSRSGHFSLPCQFIDSPSELHTTVSNLISASLNAASRKLYSKHWSAYSDFAKTHETEASPLVSAESVCLFVAHLHNKNLASATIRSYLAAISYAHKLNSLVDPTTAFIVKKCMEGSKRLSMKKTMVRLPISFDILKRLVETTERAFKSTYDILLYKAMFLLAYHACLRAGELSYSTDGSHTLSLEQIRETSKGYNITFNSFKHSRNPVKCSLRFGKVPDYCPVLALNNYLLVRGQSTGFLFLSSSHVVITRKMFCSALKLCLGKAGYDSSRYNTHSFRIGRTSDLAFSGASAETIKATGRWSSDAYKKYIKSDIFFLP